MQILFLFINVLNARIRRYRDANFGEFDQDMFDEFDDSSESGSDIFDRLEAMTRAPTLSLEYSTTTTRYVCTEFITYIFVTNRTNKKK